MKTYLTGLLAAGGMVAAILPSTANAGPFNWSSAKKIEYQTPLTIFAGQNIAIGSWNKIPDEKKADMQLVQQTAIVATVNPVAIKKIPVKPKEQTYTLLATAYSSTIDQTDDSPFITASGTRVRDGIIAANFLPFGTVIRIPEVFGNKIFVVEDRLHSRFSDRIDVWFPTREEALEFGAKRVKIEVVS